MGKVGTGLDVVNMDFGDDVNVGRPVGVAGLDNGPHDEVLRRPMLEVFNPEAGFGCLDDKLLLAGASS